MTNEADPNFIGYVKHLTAQLLMDNDMLQLPFPEFKTEKLKTIVDDSVDFLMRETDRITDQIISKLHMELDPSDIGKVIPQSHKPDEHINVRNRKRKASSILSANVPNKNLVGKLDKMEQDLEDFLNIIFSKCRPMTKAEKEQLGRLIKKLPEKALDHAVQIIQHGGNLSEGHPSQVFVDLEKQDDMTLWRLQYYAQSILKVNKLSSCNPIPLPLI
ncbi:hypothetical protein KSP39_PZI023300 [Platanthera zijinensis]|uniref:NET domain-containing protein n=1 Tax=Platanthera zijinensis TaxID=2320716 RepID=A0AAP0AUL9_9ASPA